MDTPPPFPSRRRFLGYSAAAGMIAGLDRLLPAYAQPAANVVAAKDPGVATAFDLTVDHQDLRIDGRATRAISVNDTVPGPLLRFREGQDVTLRVTNRLKEDTSIHWHGVILPARMDGVPGVSYPGIKPRETFTYKFPVKQNGTYWYHSHSGLQEQVGLFGPIIIDAAGPEPFAYDREFVVMLSDWTFEDPDVLFSKLKKQGNYYNRRQRTLVDLGREVSKDEAAAAFSDRLAWGRMRMDPTDITDITGAAFTYLMNGRGPDSNWTGLFRPGEKVRLRFINAAAATYFDVRIPGVKMTVVQADGQNVRPVPVDEFRIAVAETYDVIVELVEDKAYTIFAETADRSGYARGTLAPREGMTAPLPPRRERPLRTMADMGMGDMAGMKGMDGGGMSDMPGMGASTKTDQSMDAGTMPGMDMPGQKKPAVTMPGMSKPDAAMPGMDMPGMDMPGPAKAHTPGMDMAAAPKPSVAAAPVEHGPDTHGPGNSTVAMMSKNRLNEPGAGLENTGTKVLVYADLESIRPLPDQRPPGRDIELHITGNMERYMWSLNGKTYAEAPEPIPFYYGERLRLTLVNDTMMDHPIHLHGMWFDVETTGGRATFRKHTINVKPAERLSLHITADAPGYWAMHCHILYHMEAGMFRVVSVLPKKSEDGQ